MIFYSKLLLLNIQTELWMSYLNYKLVKKEETEEHKALHLGIRSMSWRNAQKAPPQTDNEMTIICSLVNTNFFIASPRKTQILKYFPKWNDSVHIHKCIWSSGVTENLMLLLLFTKTKQIKLHLWNTHFGYLEYPGSSEIQMQRT